MPTRKQLQAVHERRYGKPAEAALIMSLAEMVVQQARYAKNSGTLPKFFDALNIIQVDERWRRAFEQYLELRGFADIVYPPDKKK